MSDAAGTTRRRGVRGKGWWAAGYSLVAIAPLVAVLVLSDLPGRTLLLEFGSAFGVVALTLLALQLVLPSRLRAMRIAPASVSGRWQMRSTGRRSYEQPTTHPRAGRSPSR